MYEDDRVLAHVCYKVPQIYVVSAVYGFDVISYDVFSVIEGTLMHKRSAMWNI